jgi:hypothetical protein
LRIDGRSAFSLAVEGLGGTSRDRLHPEDWNKGILRGIYERMKAGKGSGKAIIATARKLLGIIYDTLKHDWVFRDFSRFEIEPKVA